MSRSASDPPPIPLPTDHTAPEYDAPPPAVGKFLPVNHAGLYPRRPATRRVVNPSEKPRVIVRG